MKLQKLWFSIWKAMLFEVCGAPTWEYLLYLFAFVAVWLLGCVLNRLFINFGSILGSCWGEFVASKS